jgi:hypothetical protein
LTACTHNCNQGRACTCAGPRTVSTRPGLFQRLQRWVARYSAQQRLTGIEQCIHSIDDELSTLQAVAFFPTPKHDEWAQLKTKTLTRERIALAAEADALSRHIKTL